MKQNHRTAFICLLCMLILGTPDLQGNFSNNLKIKFQEFVDKGKKKTKTIKDSLEKEFKKGKKRVEKAGKLVEKTGKDILAGKNVKETLKDTGTTATTDLLEYVDEDRKTLREASNVAVEESTALVRQVLRKKLDTVKQAPARKHTITVRQSSNPISSQELKFRQKRNDFIKSHQEKFLGVRLKRPMNISASASGGGMRAMLGFTGHLSALEKSGLFNLLTYIATLSGSTWALSSFYQHNLPIESFITDVVLKKLSSSNGKKDLLFNPNKHTVKDIMDALLVKWAFGLPVDPMDIYGRVIGSHFLPQPHTQRSYLSQQRPGVLSGSKPMPIYTGRWYRTTKNVEKCISEKDTNTNASSKCLQEEYVEYTPFEVGTRSLGFIDSDGFGRKFNKGKSIDKAPPLGIAYHQGTWGSAFAAQTHIIWDEVIKGALPPQFKEIKTWVSDLIKKKHTVADFQVIKGAEVPNFTKGLPNSPIKNEKYMHIGDAGISISSTPTFTLYRDKGGKEGPDVILVFDYGRGSIRELQAVAAYANQQKVSFPKIDDKLATSAQKKTFTHFKDNSKKSAPEIIYLPLLNIDFDTYGTFKFKYSTKEAKNFIQKAESSLQENIENIRKTLLAVAKKKKLIKSN